MISYNLYAFDVDHTLEIANGPVMLRQMEALRKQGHVVGLCGNWANFIRTLRESWHERISFFGPIGSTQTKAEYLSALKYYIPANRYVLIGNCEPGQSRDLEAAEQAGWSFIKETVFAKEMAFEEGLDES